VAGSSGIIDKFLMKLSSEKMRDRLVEVLSYLPYSVSRALADVHIRARQKRQRSCSMPSGLFFFITNICNQRCQHCFYSAEMERPVTALTLPQIEKLCRSIDGRISSVILCGGEPTIRNDLPEIAECFVDVARVPSLAITSNGFLQERLLQTVDRVLASKAKFELRIAISLDGWEKTHDLIRRTPGAFSRAVSTLKALEERAAVDKRLRPVINSVIQKNNAAEFMDFYKHVRTTFTCDFVFTLVRQDGRDAGGLDRSLLLDAGSDEDLLPDEETCQKLLRDIQQYEFDNGLSRSLIVWRSLVREYHLRVVREKKSVVKCILPQTNATIFPAGGVSLCEVVKPFADLKDFDYDLFACWNSEAAVQQRKQLCGCWCTYPCGLTGSMMADPDVIAAALREVRLRNANFQTRMAKS